MRVFVYEYLCASLPDDPAVAALGAEGRAMLAAVLEDLSRIADVRPVTLLHEECSLTVAGEVVRQRGLEGERERFSRLAAASDFTLVIAPEFDELLLQRTRWVVEAGGRLLGSDAEAVRLGGDKLALGMHLRARGIPTPACYSLPVPSDLPFPLVCKPRHGAGSLATFLIRDARELARCVEAAREEGWKGELLVQPFVAGTAASVAFLVGPRQRVSLVPASQTLSTDGRFHYRGGRLPLQTLLRERALRLAERAVAAVDGLRGYVGMDLVLGERESDEVVIEMNPRFTTSYIGLRRLARCNLLSSLLRLIQGQAVPQPEWRAARLSFHAEGTVTERGE